MKHTAKVIVGMSGGVDSSVAAYLLLQLGYQVEGLFMKNWEGDDDDEYCAAAQDLSDAQNVCARLNIKLHSVNFAKTYWDRVFQYFLDEYKAGRTPNPDILCNKEIKFNAFLDHAKQLGADYIATGHYVKKQFHQDHWQLLKAKDSNKDQSYFLYTLTQDALAHSLFPLAEIEKPKIREIAEQQGFINHNKKDSTGICFIGERKFKTFLQEYLLAQPGDIVSDQAEIIGKHDGLMYYTLGQRKGINIGGRQDALDAPWYVAAKDIANNRLIVVQGNQHPMLFSSGLTCSQLHWIAGNLPALPYHCMAKTRYRQADQACTLTQTEDDVYTVTFEQPQRAITPGQSIVFYDDDVCLGGAIICSAITSKSCNSEVATSS